MFVEKDSTLQPVMPKKLVAAKQDFVHGYLVNLLALVKGRTGEAARIAGWTVPNFCKLLNQYGIKPKDFRRCTSDSRAAPNKENL